MAAERTAAAAGNNSSNVQRKALQIVACLSLLAVVEQAANRSFLFRQVAVERGGDGIGGRLVVPFRQQQPRQGNRLVRVSFDDDASKNRNSGVNVPSGVVRHPDEEPYPLSDDELFRILRIEPMAFEQRWKKAGSSGGGPEPLHLPCPPVEQDWTTGSVQRSPATEGILFVKIPKTGSTTAAGVTLRIASSTYRKQQQTTAAAASGDLGGAGNSTTAAASSAAGICKNRVQHSVTNEMGYEDRDRSRSVLWSMVRGERTRRRRD